MRAASASSVLRFPPSARAAPAIFETRAAVPAASFVDPGVVRFHGERLRGLRVELGDEAVGPTWLDGHAPAEGHQGGELAQRAERPRERRAGAERRGRQRRRSLPGGLGLRGLGLRGRRRGGARGEERDREQAGTAHRSAIPGPGARRRHAQGVAVVARRSDAFPRRWIVDRPHATHVPGTMSAVAWNRFQFAFTVSFHYLFPQLTMGLALLIVIFKALALARRDGRYDDAARFWARIFGINFAIGVVTGIPLEFQFGTNWARFSDAAGGVIGLTLAMEGMFAFFAESAFLGLFLFGEKRLGRVGHLAAAVMLFLGSWLSGYFIVATNAFMQHPVGHRIGPDRQARARRHGRVPGQPVGDLGVPPHHERGRHHGRLRRHRGRRPLGAPGAPRGARAHPAAGSASSSGSSRASSSSSRAATSTASSSPRTSSRAWPRWRASSRADRTPSS